MVVGYPWTVDIQLTYFLTVHITMTRKEVILTPLHLVVDRMMLEWLVDLLRLIVLKWSVRLFNLGLFSLQRLGKSVKVVSTVKTDLVCPLKEPRGK